MSVLSEQIAKARVRARGIDLARLSDELRDKPPSVIASPREMKERQAFLAEDLNDAGQSRITFERIIEGNELQPINYLELGALAARAVCRIKLFGATGGQIGWATGFLIAPEVLITNNHVFPSAAAAARSAAQFDVELDVFGNDKTPAEFALAPDRLFHTSAALDFSVVAVAEGNPRLADYGFLPLIEATGKAVDGEWLTVIQHPGGERKQVCVRENQLLTRTDEVLWYSTDTLGGSSGSPVFNNSWQVVALHHKGVPEEKQGRIQTVDGRDYDPGRDDETAIKWVANEGVRISRIVAALRAALPGHPLLADVFEMTPARAHAVTVAQVARQSSAPPAATGFPSLQPRPEGFAMSRSVTVTLDIADDGRVSVRGAGSPAEAAWLERDTPAKPKPKPSGPDVEPLPFNADYSTRNGYQDGFLGDGFAVHAPDAGLQLPSVAARLLGVAEGSTAAADYTLKYTNYSVMLHAKRRLALWTAASVDGGNRFQIGRTSDQWRYDPRVDRDLQLGNFYYAKNQFDRGHLTRREDMEYGPTLLDAVAAADDTCHWSNCTPQHAKFNELGYLWQNLEKHILEGAIKANKFAAQVFTGPILDEGDPVWSKFPDIQYPVRFWKIAVALYEEGLFAAGFILDQSAAIAQFGIEATEAPFGPFETYQVPLAEIEDQTGLTFSFSKDGNKQSLSVADPLATTAGRAAAARRRRLSANEAFSSVAPPAGYVRLEDGASIVR